VSGETAHRYLRPEDIRRLDSYEFAPKLVVEGYLSGRHRSRARGSSTEFRDYRPYAPGDDPALVDWRVFARTERHYIRTFEQETDMECTLFLDGSASMGFGGPTTKLDYASFLTAALAYLVVRMGDRVGLRIFDRTVRDHVPPGGTRRHLNHVLNKLENNKPGAETSLAEALRHALPTVTRRGVLIILSDFLDDAQDIFAALSPYLHRGFQILLLQIADVQEIDLPRSGLLTFEDMETGQRTVAHTESIRAAYKAQVREHERVLRELASRRRVEFHALRTDTPIHHVLDLILR